MIRSGNAISSHTALISFETVYEKSPDCFGRFRKFDYCIYSIKRRPRTNTALDETQHFRAEILINAALEQTLDLIRRMRRLLEDIKKNLATTW